MRKLRELNSFCESSLEIKFNGHNDVYKSIEQYLLDLEMTMDLDEDELPRDIRDKIIGLNTIVEINAYIHSPVGCVTFYNYDIDLCIDRALEVIRKI